MKGYAPSFTDTEELGEFLSALRSARTLIASAALPGFYPKTLLVEARKTTLEYAEYLDKEGITTLSFPDLDEKCDERKKGGGKR